MLTNAEHLEVDHLYWDTLAAKSLGAVLVSLDSAIIKNTEWISRTHPRMTEATAALDSVNTADVRKAKDAQTEVDNCVKLLSRLESEVIELQRKYDQAMKERNTVIARIAVHPPGGKIHQACRGRYPGYEH